ncbi:MAG: hypothetical protein DMG30_17035 [Acidobacteria bacterium]|nr:MAG: hypothetical protein DMG30_17035 [Acidobacteriota bacterium]
MNKLFANNSQDTIVAVLRWSDGFVHRCKLSRTLCEPIPVDEDCRFSTQHIRRSARREMFDSFRERSEDVAAAAGTEAAVTLGQQV